MELTPLKSFLYELMRDHLSCGDVELIVRHTEAEKEKYPLTFSNSDLANYAEKLAIRLTKTT